MLGPRAGRPGEVDLEAIASPFERSAAQVRREVEGLLDELETLVGFTAYVQDTTEPCDDGPGTRYAQVVAVEALPGAQAELLAAVEARWSGQGYTVERSGQTPQLVVETGDGDLRAVEAREERNVVSVIGPCLPTDLGEPDALISLLAVLDAVYVPIVVEDTVREDGGDLSCGDAAGAEFVSLLRGSCHDGVPR